MAATMQISTNTPVKTEDNTTMFTDDSMTDGAADVLSIEYLVTGIISVNFHNFYRLQSYRYYLTFSIQCAVQ